MENLDFSSISKFKETIRETLKQKALAQIVAKRDEFLSVDESSIEDVDEESDEVEISFSPEDLPDIIRIAKETNTEYEVDDNDELTITDSNEDRIDDFFNALDDAGIDYEVETEEYDMNEAALRRVHTSAKDKRKNKKAYRKNKSKLKIKAKRYRKTAHAKRLKKIGKRKSRQGKTATGRRMIKRI